MYRISTDGRRVFGDDEAFGQDCWGVHVIVGPGRWGIWLLPVVF